MAPLLIVVVLVVALGVLGARFGTDSRDGVDALPQRWIARRYDE